MVLFHRNCSFLLLKPFPYWKTKGLVVRPRLKQLGYASHSKRGCSEEATLGATAAA